jgi:hypothetical protein
MDKWINGRIEKWMNEMENLFVCYPAIYVDLEEVISPYNYLEHLEHLLYPDPRGIKSP